MKNTGFDFEESAILDRIYGPAEHPKTETEFNTDILSTRDAGIEISDSEESILRDAFNREYWHSFSLSDEL